MKIDTQNLFYGCAPEGAMNDREFFDRDLNGSCDHGTARPAESAAGGGDDGVLTDSLANTASEGCPHVAFRPGK